MTKAVPITDPVGSVAFEDGSIGTAIGIGSASDLDLERLPELPEFADGGEAADVPASYLAKLAKFAEAGEPAAPVVDPDKVVVSKADLKAAVDALFTQSQQFHQLAKHAPLVGAPQSAVQEWEAKAKDIRELHNRLTKLASDVPLTGVFSANEQRHDS